jgi:hypothetical protein
LKSVHSLSHTTHAQSLLHPLFSPPLVCVQSIKRGNRIRSFNSSGYLFSFFLY